MIAVADQQERPPRDSDWVSGRVAIAAHVIDRAKERLGVKFQGTRRRKVASMIERAVRHPMGEVEPHAAIQDGAFQVAVPFVDISSGAPRGFLVVGKDPGRAGIIVMTWLEPGMIEHNRESNRRMGLSFEALPAWWRAFQTCPDEPGFGVDKRDQTG